MLLNRSVAQHPVLKQLISGCKARIERAMISDSGVVSSSGDRLHLVSHCLAFLGDNSSATAVSNLFRGAPVDMRTPEFTVRSTGPGLLTQVLDCHFREQQQQGVRQGASSSSQPGSPERGCSDVLVLPYFVFSPVPNNAKIPSLADDSESARNLLKELRLLYCSEWEDNNEDSVEPFSGEDANPEPKVVGIGGVVAIHWWQRSWQDNSNP